MNEIPDYILCGHINLHNNQWCAAQFVTYINHALERYTLDDQGHFNNNYLAYKRSPKTVSEWKRSRQNQIDDDLTDDTTSSDTLPQQSLDTSQGFQRNLNEFVSNIRKEVELNQLTAKMHTDSSQSRKNPSGFLFAVQEPHTHLRKLTLIKGTTSIYDPNAKKIRAALVMSSTLNFWPCTDLMTGDLAVGQLLLNNGKAIYVASYYADADKTAIHNKIKQMVNKATREGKEVLIMGDFNAHSEALWNDKNTDNREKAWEEYVATKPLQVQNIGDTFTFHTKRGQTIIDVTVSSDNLAPLIKELRVADSIPASDHCSVEFILQVQGDTWVPKYNLTKANLSRLHDHMEETPVEININEPWTRDKFGFEASR